MQSAITSSDKPQIWSKFQQVHISLFFKNKYAIPSLIIALETRTTLSKSQRPSRQPRRDTPNVLGVSLLRTPSS